MPRLRVCRPALFLGKMDCAPSFRCLIILALNIAKPVQENTNIPDADIISE